MHTPRTIVLPFLAAALLPAGCTPDTPGKAAKPQRTALVRLAPATTRSMPHKIEAVGTVRPSATVTLVSRTAGRLEKSLASDGAEVSPGQLLFVIEKKPYEIALHQVQARLESDRAKLSKARDDYSRAQKLGRGGFSSAAETDESRVALASAQAAVREDEASLEKALLDLSYCEIRSPLAGRTGEVKVDEGNVVPVQTQLVVIDDFSPAEVNFSVPEKYQPVILKKSREGTATAEALAKDGSLVEGRIIFAGSIDSDTGTVPLKAAFANKDRKLWPGEFLKLHVLLETLDNAVVVPSRAVVLGPDGPFVYVVGEDRKAVIRLVQTGIEADGFTVISKGLSAGERTVLEGHVRLKNGMSVTIADDRPPEEAANGEKDSRR